jgi:hypothetical protein
MALAFAAPLIKSPPEQVEGPVAEQLAGQDMLGTLVD